MFEDSLIESAGRIHTKRGWTTVVSVGFQAVAIGVMILIPLIYTEALPSQMMTTFLVAPPPPPPPPPPAAMVKVTKIETEMENGALRTPTKIPEKVKMVKEEEAPPSTGMMGGVQGGVPGGALSGVIGGIIGSTANLPKVAAPQRIRVSGGVTAGNLLRRVEPVYPPLAKTARIQGQVILHAVISKSGSIENLQVMSGHPMLVQSALDAVRQWKYKPYILNGEPVEVDTTVTVNYNLSGG
ncbi:MAG TPA: energy transducer TonB [Candidatus Angelobacter sp.]|nr:energy transducer TonB [Candidatus Angelobacter sp.]